MIGSNYFVGMRWGYGFFNNCSCITLVRLVYLF